MCAIVLDYEKLVQQSHEQRSALASAHGEPAPRTPVTNLSNDEIKEIRRVASDSRLLTALPELLDLFHRASLRGVAAMFDLPAPFASLKELDGVWIDPILATGNRSAYFR